MKKPKLQVKGVFVPEIEGMNAGQICSAYEGMMDALLHVLDNAGSLELDSGTVRIILTALKKAGCVE